MNFLISFLLSTYWLRKIPVASRIWNKLYMYVLQAPVKPIKVKLHNYTAVQPSTYAYPINARAFPLFNNPLIECVFQTFKYKQGKVNVVDIGAAIGDTVFLLKANCPEMTQIIYCIDGDDEFFGYLEKNMSPFNDVQCYHTLLASTNSEVNELVRIHGGTASAQGNSKRTASTFDDWALKSYVHQLDVLKIDVDGFDGKVLRGALGSLSKFQPTVIFEWHPILCSKTNSDYIEPFRVLGEAGYDRFVWFTKYGNFSHFCFQADKKYLNEFANICFNSSFDTDWHYDIVALHKDSKLSVLDFANSDYSRNKKSAY